MKSALTIASSDSSGGAGISADLRAFSYAGVHGCNVVCCVTAQNTKEVVTIHEVPLDVISRQLDAVLDDIKISGCKTGMLYSPDIVALIGSRAKDFEFPLVVDPVMKATVGGDLSRENFASSLIKHLIPRATLVTPNIPEAEVLTGLSIKSVDDMKSAAEKIHALGCDFVLLKGGHLKEPAACDVLYDGNEYHLYLSSRFPVEFHGTGCMHSALISGFLARGMDVLEAVSEARIHISNLIESGYMIGGGVGVVGMVSKAQFSPLESEIIESLHSALFELLDVLPLSLVPEVGINFGFALPDGKNLDDVCALEGRLIRIGDGARPIGELKFGASKHVGRIILTAMKFDSEIRSAMNISYSPEVVDLCSSLGFLVGNFDRQNEPEKASSMEWGTEFAINVLGRVPDVIYDTGGIGKEPMIRILGTSPEDVLGKLKKIVEMIAL